MTHQVLKASRLLSLLFLVLLALPAAAQTSSSQPTRDMSSNPSLRTVEAGRKVKLRGPIVRRDGDTFNIRDEQGYETMVLLTDRTSVKSKGGWFRSGTNYDVTSLLRGLPVEVEGRGNADGLLVAEKVRFSSDDLKMARIVESRVSPVEEENRRMSGQIGEANELARTARGEADRANAGVAAANERISALDDYDIQDQTTVFFRVNSAVLSPEARQALDQIAQKALNTRGYVIEIAGYTDTSGNLELNRRLSQRRADAVVRYLQENYDIPLRRMITPYGYGEARPVADNTTPEGRRQNRRVEVRVLISRGLNQQPAR